MSEMSTEYAYSVRDKGTGGQPDPKGVMSKFCVISQLFANKNIRRSYSNRIHKARTRVLPGHLEVTRGGAELKF